MTRARDHTSRQSLVPTAGAKRAHPAILPPRVNIAYVMGARPNFVRMAPA
jgi:hypothetical protein